MSLERQTISSVAEVLPLEEQFKQARSAAELSEILSRLGREGEANLALTIQRLIDNNAEAAAFETRFEKYEKKAAGTITPELIPLLRRLVEKHVSTRVNTQSEKVPQSIENELVSQAPLEEPKVYHQYEDSGLDARLESAQSPGELVIPLREAGMIAEAKLTEKIQNLMNNNASKEALENRFRNSGVRLEGVLLNKLQQFVNEYLSSQQESIVQETNRQWGIEVAEGLQKQIENAQGVEGLEALHKYIMERYNEGKTAGIFSFTDREGKDHMLAAFLGPLNYLLAKDEGIQSLESLKERMYRESETPELLKSYLAQNTPTSFGFQDKIFSIIDQIFGEYRESQRVLLQRLSQTKDIGEVIQCLTPLAERNRTLVTSVGRQSVDLEKEIATLLALRHLQDTEKDPETYKSSAKTLIEQLTPLLGIQARAEILCLKNREEGLEVSESQNVDKVPTKVDESPKVPTSVEPAPTPTTLKDESATQAVPHIEGDFLKVEISNVALLEMLGGVEGFNELSRSQQILAYKNLEEFYGAPSDGFLGRVWEGALSKAPGSERRAVEKDTKARQAAQKIVEFIASERLKVHVTENGDVLPSLVPLEGSEIPREHRKEIIDAETRLNSAGHALARMPYAWRENGVDTQGKRENKIVKFLKDRFSPTRGLREKYSTSQAEYSDAKRALAKALVYAGTDSRTVARKLLEAEKRMTLHQFLQTSLEEVSEIQKHVPTDTAREIGAGLFSNGKGKAGSEGLGFINRTAIARLLNTVISPVVASQMRERDRQAREVGSGGSDVPTDISAGPITRTDGRVQPGAIETMQDLLRNIPSETGDSTVERRRFISELTQQVKSMEASLKANRVDFGPSEVAPVHIEQFFEALIEARMVLADERENAIPSRIYKGRDSSTLSQRIVDMLGTNAANSRNVTRVARRIAATDVARREIESIQPLKGN